MVGEEDSSSDLMSEYEDSEDNKFMVGMSDEQKRIAEERLHSYQEQFRVYNTNQRDRKILDVQKHLPEIDAKTAQLAIDSCHDNELLAIKRLLEDAEYRATVIAMSSGEAPLDMNAIMYIDRRQELREALSYEPEETVDSDDSDNWELKVHMHHVSSNDSDHEETDDSDSYSSCEYSGRHRTSKTERKVPRLCLDDALIMLANVQTQSFEEKTSHSPLKETDADTILSREDSSKTEVATDASTPSSQSESTVSSAKIRRQVKRAHKETSGDESSSSEYDGSDSSSSSKRSRTSKAMLAKEADLFRALSGGASQKIKSGILRQLGWSEARIKAFKNREKNPNQYYYRFNDPGEPQATGKWSSKDKSLFLKLIQERGVDYQWGIFAKNIPGRVGYQCSNFYRQLIKEGEIKDENYTYDSKGKLVFKFRDKRGNSTLVRRNSRRRRNSSDDSEEMDDFDLQVDEEEEENVLPDFIDPMTMMPVVKPAISPYGHVMGYDSWVKVLNRNPKNTCPFTKKKLTRRSLIKLTADNIDEYRDRIINVNGFEFDFHCN